MPPTTSTNIHHVLVKRQLLRFNLGGQEQNPDISGHKNQVMYGSAADSEMKLTLLRKAGHQAGRILEGGTDIVVASARWLTYMQENWYAYHIKMYTDPLRRPNHFGFSRLQQK
ncbi:unnamed protein product [Rotaria magnacalcarata]|uniref:Uncharacterized protein n=1 Tax=Rotaria magnacalcarata TaxID=392030 RepID=A0A815QTE6_9BILA|nr:unnamed protein product [Rotaria magnacalcarata]CAF1467681.1 unnamed protein product [Rotaria magnacalcarata]CAF2117500.1 unnamed protein product [Rotaria magnacalcarata]CAF4371882.1 unnamed protein product [Rotaria magnacalcarata]CAF4647078.1 unnamed protein product [Rotaria magnacalcarata]